MLLILLMACNKTAIKSPIVSYNIENAVKNVEHVMLSDIANDIVYIPLETTKESIVANIRNIIFTSEYILVEDDFEKLLLFNKDGKFLRRIGQKGNGPDEYLSANNIRISSSNEELYVFDGNRLKIMVFNLKTGKCTRKATLNFIPSDFEFFNDTTLAFYCSTASFAFSQKNYHIFLVDTQHLKVTDSLYKENILQIKDLATIDYGFIKLYKDDNKLFCWDSNLDTVFYLDESKKTIKSHVFQYDKYKMPAKYNYNSDFLNVKHNSFYLNKLFETDKYFFLEGVYNMTYMRNILFNKNDQTSRNVVFDYEIQDQGFINDIDGGIPFWPKGVARPNELYDYISPIILKRLLKNDFFETIPVKNKEQNKQLKDALNNCNISDNPIIFIAKLKK